MAFGDGNVIFTSNAGKIRLSLGYSDTVGDSFTLSGASYMSSSDADGDLRLGKGSTDKALKCTGFTSTINDSFTLPGSPTPYGQTCDDSYTYFSDDGGNKMRQLTGYSATVNNSFSSPSSNPMGISIQSGNFFSGDQVSGKARKHSGFSSTISNSITPTGFTVCYSVTLTDADTIVGKDSVNKRLTGFTTTVNDSYTPVSNGQWDIEWDDYAARNDATEPVTLKIVTDTMIATASSIKSTTKNLVDTMTATASAIKTAIKNLADSITGTASIVRSTVRNIIDTMTATASYNAIRILFKTVTNTMTATASVIKMPIKSFLSSSTFTTSVATIKLYFVIATNKIKTRASTYLLGAILNGTILSLVWKKRTKPTSSSWTKRKKP